MFATVPVIESPAACAEAIETWDIGGPDRLLVVDNSPKCQWEQLVRERGWDYVGFGQNIGVSAAWNLGRDWMFDRADGYSFLLIFSASVVWHDGLTASLQQMDNAANWKGVLTSLGFHGLYWSKQLLERFGRFDENFDTYFGDNDMLIRLALEGIEDIRTCAEEVPKEQPFHNIEINASCEDAKAFKAGVVKPDLYSLSMYYQAKWGGMPCSETYRTPFNLPVPVSWWSPHFKPGLQ